MNGLPDSQFHNGGKSRENVEKMSRITLGKFPDFFSRWARWDIFDRNLLEVPVLTVTASY